MSDLLPKLKALIKALPAQLALVQAVLVALGTVVPLLPVAAQAKVAALLALAAGWVAAAVRVVSRVTPVPGGAEGLLVPRGKMVTTAVTPVGVSVDVGARGASVITTTNPAD